jgi:hypothetical protein
MPKHLAECDSAINAVQAAAQTLGHELFVAKARSEGDIDSAFRDLEQRRVGAIQVGNDASKPH